MAISGICRICGCTETTPCQVVLFGTVVLCSWLDKDRDLCTNRSCIEKAYRQIPNLFLEQEAL